MQLRSLLCASLDEMLAQPTPRTSLHLHKAAQIQVSNCFCFNNIMQREKDSLYENRLKQYVAEAIGTLRFLFYGTLNKL